MVFNEVSLLGFLLTFFCFFSHSDFRAVGRVVEVNDVDVKHQHGGSRDLRS